MTWKLTYPFLLLLLFPSSNKFLRAQAIGGGQIQGTITDANGSAVSGATVVAVQQASGLHRTVSSSGDGGYNLPDLPVGPYQLNVTAPGFSTYQQSGIVIEVGNNISRGASANSQVFSIGSGWHLVLPGRWSFCGP